MAYAQGFWRISALFTIINTDETAQFDFSLCSNPGMPLATSPPVDLLEDISARVATLMGSSVISWADYSRFIAVKGVAIAVNGEYADEATLYTRPTAASGSSSSVSPAETICVSLRSGQSLGKGNYGRMYLPHTRLPLTTGSPYGDSTAQSTFATAAQTFVQGVNDDAQAVDAQVAMKIMSQAQGTPAKTVDQVAVGRVIDTQRRRRRSLTENYQFRTIAP